MLVRFLGLLSTCLVVACGSPSIEVQLSIDLSAAPELTGTLTLKDLHIQPPGHELMPDHSVTAEWLPIVLTKTQIDIQGAAESPVLIAQSSIPKAAYERLFLRPAKFDFQDTDGRQVQVQNVLEPIAHPFRHRRASSIDFTVAVLPVAGSPGTYLIAAK